jgi:hypothetical protein
MDFRRRVPRVAMTGWPGRYIVEDEPHSGWNECRVRDISLIGVAVELFGDVPVDLVGPRLIVQLKPPAGESAGIRIVGRIMNLSKGIEGGARAGLEFVSLSDTERAILKVLEQVNAAW